MIMRCPPYFPNGFYQTEHLPGKYKKRVVRNFHYKSLSGRVFVAIEGTIENGYSIPWWLKGLFFRVLRYPEGAGLHDPAYGGELWELVDGELVKANLTRKESDRLIKEVLRRMGASKALYRAIHKGLQISGAANFKGYKG